MCGAAGIRVGYGSFPLSLIEYMWRAKQPYNVSVAAETAACAALTNPSYLEDVQNLLVEERKRLFDVLQSVSLLEPYQSAANFILCKVRTSGRDNRSTVPVCCTRMLTSLAEQVNGRDAKEVKDALMAEGIMVRHYAKKELSGYVRVSVGKPEHTDALQQALQRM